MATQVQPKDKTVLVNGLKLHYLDWGNDTQIPMLLVHGLRGHAHSWDDVSAAFCPHYHVLALDQRGRGDSDWAADGNYSTQAYVDDLAAFCEALSLPPFILVGHSMGGRNSMAFAARYPERVQQLIIVDIGPTIDPRGAERIKQEIHAVPEAFDSFDAVVAYMSQQNRYTSDAVLRRRLRYATQALPDGKTGWRYDLAIREQSRQGTAAPAEDLWPQLPRITCPTLIVRGADTDLLSPEIAQQMLDTLPNAQLAEVQRAAHMVFEENPDGFMEVMRHYLQ
jgi:pimeloyl-ACP methyl ester carboxylesterase